MTNPFPRLFRSRDKPKNSVTSFDEAMRIFATQSLVEKRMPFQVTAGKGQAFGIASKYAKPDLIGWEKGAYARAMEEKHEL